MCGIECFIVFTLCLIVFFFIKLQNLVHMYVLTHVSLMGLFYSFLPCDERNLPCLEQRGGVETPYMSLEATCQSQ